MCRSLPFLWKCCNLYMRTKAQNQFCASAEEMTELLLLKLSRQLKDRIIAVSESVSLGSFGAAPPLLPHEIPPEMQFVFCKGLSVSKADINFC